MPPPAPAKVATFEELAPSSWRGLFCHRYLMFQKREVIICDMDCKRCHKPFEPGQPVYWVRQYMAGYSSWRVCAACEPRINYGGIGTRPLLEGQACWICQRPIVVERFFQLVKRNRHKWVCSPECLNVTRRRPRLFHTCQMCGERFEARRGARFCSARCRKQAHRRRDRTE